MYQLYIQLSHSSHISVFPFQQLTEHFVQRSTGHVKQFSPGSIFQLPQFGNSGLYVVHEAVHALPFIQLLFHKSHSSYSSFILSQHSWFESTILQYSEHFPSHQFHAQLSHSSPGSTIQLPHELVQLHTSFGQLLQSSASSIIPFQQNPVHFHTSFSQFEQFSPGSIILFQHSQDCSQLFIQISFKSAEQFSHFSFSFNSLLGQELFSLQSVVQL
ncbi:hypothetical protein IKN40_00375 [bacterium]|nr:hypothetical protein [bacterium]